jgi:hypothetical protein
MIPRSAWFLSALLLFTAAPMSGCPGGSLTVLDDDDQGDDDSQGDDDDQGDDDAQGDDDDSQGDDDDQGDDDSQGDDDDSPFAGEYEGAVQLSVDSPQGPMVFEGPLLAFVSATGAVTCHGEVDSPMDAVVVEISGGVGGDGVFVGETYQGPANTPPQGPFETDGEFAVDGFGLRWSGSIPTPDGQEIQFQGSANGWPL